MNVAFVIEQGSDWKLPVTTSAHHYSQDVQPIFDILGSPVLPTNNCIE